MSSTSLDRTGESLDPPAWVETRPMVPAECLYYFGTGWPLPCVYYASLLDGRRALSFLKSDRVDGAIRGRNFLLKKPNKTGFHLGSALFLPVAPIWSGLLLNSLLYGFAAFVVFNIFNFRRRLQARQPIRRKLCAMCGYEQRGNPRETCPECGCDASDRPPFVTRPVLASVSVLIAFLVLLHVGYAMMFVRNDPFQTIHYAAYNGDIETLWAELNDGVTVEKPVRDYGSHSGITPLNLAVRGGSIEAVDVLIKAGANVNGTETVQLREAFGGPPLFLAAWHGQPKISRRLIEAGANVNATDQSGKTPLHWAAMFNRAEVVRVLIDQGARVNLQDRGGYTALHFAIPNEDDTALKKLLRAGADVRIVNKDGLTPLAAGLENPEIMRVLMKYGAEVSFSALREAVRINKLDVFKTLIEKGGHPGARGPKDRTLLFHVAEFDPGSSGVAMGQYLIDQGIDVNAKSATGKTALEWSLETEKYEYARLLLQNGADITFDAMTIVIEKQNERMLKLLVEHGADVTMRGPDGETLLFYVTEDSTNQSLWRFLLDQGIDVNATRDDGTSAFRNAITQGMYQFAKFLKEHGAKSNASESKSDTEGSTNESNGNSADEI